MGALCGKVADFDRHHYNPDRVLYPMKRVGPKGAGVFERITWTEALDTIHERFSGIIAEHGAEAILPYNYLGNEGVIQGLTVGDAFFNKLGASVAEKTFCGSGSSTAWLLTVGPTNGTDPLSFSESKLIVIWGCNSISTNIHHWHIVKEAQRGGAKVIVDRSLQVAHREGSRLAHPTEARHRRRLGDGDDQRDHQRQSRRQ